MDINLRHDADKIIQASIQAVKPDEAVSRAVDEKERSGSTRRRLERRATADVEEWKLRRKRSLSI